LNSNSTTESLQERAARWAPQHPKPICTDFIPQPEPAEFWCVTCGWNQPLHADDEYRQAIAVELAKLAKGDAR
jgi:hypothetical protein